MRESLENLTDRLILDCLLRATVQGPVLATFRDSVRPAFGLDVYIKNAEQTSETTALIADERSIMRCLADEPDFFNAGLEFATVPFDEIRLQSDASQTGDVDETLDHSGIAVLRVPSHISLPLYHALLSVVHIMVRLLVHTAPKPESCQTFSVILCDALLSEYLHIADQYLSASHSESLESEDVTKSDTAVLPSGVIPPRALQLMFDVHFLIKLLNSCSLPVQSNRLDLNGPQPTHRFETEVHIKAKHLLSKLESLLDPFDLEVSSPRLSSAVSMAFNGLAHLYAPLIRPGTIIQVSSVKTTDATTDSSTTESKWATSTFMPLLNGQNRPSFTALPLTFSACFDKRRSKANRMESLKVVCCFSIIKQMFLVDIQHSGFASFCDPALHCCCLNQNASVKYVGSFIDAGCISSVDDWRFTLLIL
ncbi:hypothetical protein FBUS_02402 [Fasciolopsis buskii]|uniref:Conserved oligomeric Golgi complex subunit 1 n=1 Tax=Fasciolopsis buskii TaxID=27845 RepID=A0A8E0VP97_9TREM|nr:hypothetical protein FBUS_02402 [Fasciolopsis buski]